MNPIILSFGPAWGMSGLRLDDFCQLLDDLQATGHVYRNQSTIVFKSLRVATLVLGSGRRRRGKRGAR